MSYHVNEEGYRRKRASILYRGAWYALERGLYGLGEAMAQVSLDDGRAVLDRDDSRIWDSMSILARALSEQGRFEQAEEWHREALGGYEKMLGVDHYLTIVGTGNLARVLGLQAKYAQAEEMHR